MSAAAPGPEILVLGLGNPMMGDDGFGAAAVEAMHARWIPSFIRARAVDDVLQLSAHWRGEPRVWLLDAVLAGEVPGRISRFGHDRLLALQPGSGAAHHLDLATALSWLRLATPHLQQVRFHLWGCEPQRIAPVAGLTPAVATAAARVAEEILGTATAAFAQATARRDPEAAVVVG